MNNNIENFLNLNITQKVNWTKYDLFNMLYFNINSLRNKLYDIEELVYRNRSKTIHFVALTETRIFDHETDFFNIPNYHSYFSNRSDGHGGAALFVHDTLDSNLVTSGEEFKVNYVIVNIPALKTSVAVVYKKPTVCLNKFLEVLNKIHDQTSNIILIGDTNLDVQSQSNNINTYLAALRSHGCCLLNSREKKFATRINKRINARHTQSSTIDHVITNNTRFKFNIGLNESHLSDHKSIFISFRDTTNRFVNFAKTEYNLYVKQLPLNTFKTILARELAIFQPTDPSSLFFIIENVKKRCIQVRQLNIKHNPYKKWVNDELIAHIRERNRYSKLKRKYPQNTYVQSKHTELCQLIRAKRNELRRKFNSSELNKCISKPRQMWKKINEILHNKPTQKNQIRSLTLANGNVVHEKKTIANELNQYFCSIGNELFQNIPHTDRSYHNLIEFNMNSMALFPASIDEVGKTINNIKNNTNLDDILPSCFIKSCREILLQPITSAVNSCLSEGVFPDELKTSRIVPIYKSGDSMQPVNYRPINILSDFSKIFELCIYERVVDFLTKFNIIDENQFGFQRKSGTLSAAITILDEIKISLDFSNRNICACLFLDLTKAFDTIPHEILMSKLYRYGFRGKAADLLKSFLNNRKQFVSLGDEKSQPLHNAFGTPQGSTLGPILFLLYVNDIFKLKLHGKIVLFADDAAIIYCSNNINTLHTMMCEDIEILLNWFIANKLTLNLKKSKCMIFHPQQKTKKYTLNININGSPIEQVSKFEYLGISLQEDMRWDGHINSICSKISSIAGVMNRLGNTVDKNTLISLYYAHVNSHISYMSPLWGNAATDTLLNSLQVVQNQALRSLFRVDYYANGLGTEEIRNKHKILSIRQNIQYNTATLAFKIKNGQIKSNIQLNEINSRHSYPTRQSRNLYQCGFRTNSGKHLTSRIIAIEYNKLPTIIQNSQSIFTFKKNLKTQILTT